MALPKFPTINQELLSQLRGLFFSKDNPIILPNNGFIGLHSLDTPSENPPFPYRFVYIKADGCVYILDYEGNEYKLFSANNLHTHSDDTEGGSTLSPKVVGGIVIGNHSDFTVAQDAINYAAGNGYSRVYFPNGTYANVVVYTSGMVITCDNSALFQDTGGHCIEITSNHISWYGGRCNGTSGGGNNYDGFHVSNGADRVKLIGIYIESSDRHGIYTDASFTVISGADFIVGQIDNNDIYFDTNSNECIADTLANNDGGNTDLGVGNVVGDAS